MQLGCVSSALPAPLCEANLHCSRPQVRSASTVCLWVRRPAQAQASSAGATGSSLDFEAQAARLAAAVAEEADSPRSDLLPGSKEEDDLAAQGPGAAPGSEAEPPSLASPAPAEGVQATDPIPAALGRRGRRARLDPELLRAVQAASAPDAAAADDAAALRDSLGAVLGISGAGGAYGLQVPRADMERRSWSVADPATRGIVSAPGAGAAAATGGGRTAGFRAGASWAGAAEGLAQRVAELEAALGMLSASSAQADAQLRAAVAEVQPATAAVLGRNVAMGLFR